MNLILTYERNIGVVEGRACEKLKVTATSYDIENKSNGH